MLDTSPSGKKYYLGKKAQHLDKMILNVKLPSEIKRLPRSVTTRKFWKASEWRSFLLFYSPVFLKDLLPAVYYNHWLLLSFAVYTLLQDNITRDDILLAECALHKFFVLVSDLYGIEHVSYNVHLLTHLAASVKSRGPLWANSAFLFENANGKLLHSFHVTKGVSKQIFKLLLSSRFLGQLTEKHIEGSNDVITECFQQLTNTSVRCKNATVLGENMYAVGSHRQCTLNDREIAAIEEFLHCKISPNVKRYSRFINNGCVFHTCDYSASYKANDSYVSLLDRKGLFQISSILSVCITSSKECAEKCVLILKVLLYEPLVNYDASVKAIITRHVGSAFRSEQIVVCHPSTIVKKCIVLPYENQKLYSIVLPVFELD